MLSAYWGQRWLRATPSGGFAPRQGIPGPRHSLAAFLSATDSLRRICVARHRQGQTLTATAKVQGVVVFK